MKYIETMIISIGKKINMIGGRVLRNAILTLTIMNIMFMFMHEFDACYQGEWKMFKFLRKLEEKKQYLIFIYFHIPLVLIYLYYFYVVLNFNNFYLWVVINIISILHLLIHLVASRWSSNVFKSMHSFAFIGGAAVTGGLNLLLLNYYR